MGEDHDGLLVLSGELPTPLLFGQVQVAPPLAPDHDRDAQEGPHPGMVHREPVALGMLADVGQPQRLRVLNQHPEHAAPARKVADRTVGGGVDPDREEALELPPRVVEHAERRIPGTGDLASLLEDAVEHRLGVVLGNQCPTHLQ